MKRYLPILCKFTQNCPSLPPDMNKLSKFLKDWMLPIGMATGACLYLVYHNIPAIHPAGGFLLKAVHVIQPALLFLMLYLTFCRIEPKQLRPHRWQWWLILLQIGTFSLTALAALLLPEGDARTVLESLMICLICPTATAASVITDKLGGDIAGVITYTILINMATAVAVPVFVPLLHPSASAGFTQAFTLILAKVFPLLICPCLLAWMTRYMAPRLHRKLIRHTDLPFRIWAVSLTLAILMTTRAIIHSGSSFRLLALIAGASLLSCIFQFAAGKAIGRAYGQEVSAGQSLGQKNTVFAIWMGYSFMTPITAVAGGFYSIWHNCFNSWQLYRQRKGGKA